MKRSDDGRADVTDTRHDHRVHGTRPTRTGWIERWLERCGRAFVMEIECRDGTRYLVGLDPSWHGNPTLAIESTDDGAATGLSDVLRSRRRDA